MQWRELSTRYYGTGPSSPSSLSSLRNELSTVRFELTRGRYMAFPVLPLNYILKIEKNCWSSDGIEPSLIDYSISTNKDEYDFFYLKVKEIGATFQGFWYRGMRLTLPR